MSLRFRINFTLPDGSEDSVIVEGETTEEIREKADDEVRERIGRDPWSEQLS